MAPSTREVAPGSPPRLVPAGGDRFGLVVGIDVYREERLSLRCAAADARAIHAVMIDPRCGLFPESNVKLLVNEQATTSAVWSALADLRRAGPDDTVWIFFAGHGAIEGDEGYWVTHDADVDDLYKTALDRRRINDVLSRLASKQVLLLLDCCHAAATALQKNKRRSVLTRKEMFGRFEGEGVITVAAADGPQSSVELTELGHGAFTYYLEKGLRGEADEDGDGVVTADELWSYLHKKVEAASAKLNNRQTPVLMGKMTHDIALTLNPEVVEARKAAPVSEASPKSGGPSRLPWERPPGWKLWRPGETLRIQFLNGEPEEQEEIKRIAAEWLRHANLKFEYVQSGGVIRIKLAPHEGSWSYVGTDAEAVPPAEPTMTLYSKRTVGPKFFETMVLHEFGHLLGLIHEHTSPKASIPWNRDLIYDRMRQEHGMTKAEIDMNMFSQYSEEELPGYRPFDPKSIMMYHQPPEFTLDKMELGGDTLSESDKRFVAKLYRKKKK